MSELSTPRVAHAESLVPSGYAEKAMASLLQLHTELMEEKERRVDLYRRLMEKEQAIAELKMYVKLLEEKAQQSKPAEAALKAEPFVRAVTPVAAGNVERAAGSASPVANANVESAAKHSGAGNVEAVAPVAAASVEAVAKPERPVPPPRPMQGSQTPATARPMRASQTPVTSPRPTQISQPMQTSSRPMPKIQSAQIPGAAFPRTAARKIEDWKTW